MATAPHRFWIEYVSYGDWRSNVGEGEVFVTGCEMDCKARPFPEIPFFAIDYVVGKELYAIDLNVAPGVRGSGVEKYLDGADFCAVLEKYMSEGHLGKESV